MKHTFNPHHWFNYLTPITLSIFSTICIGNSSLATPLCYLIDANGKRINLSFLCSTSKSVSPDPSTTATPTTTAPNIPPAIAPTNPPAPNETAPDETASPQTQLPTQTNTDSTQKPEVDRSKLPPVERAIPLLQNQKTPQIDN